ncbi:MAG: mechanosensitive ion channel family protein [Anaerolineales bacterium]|jgi:small conductance mechanosensitive channel
MDRFRVFLAFHKGSESAEAQISIRLACTLCGLLLLILFACSTAFTTPAMAQIGQPPNPTPPVNEPTLEAPDQINVEPTARDEQIRHRLQSILESTGWFSNPKVQVREGVVFLTGQTATDDYKKWAGDLARNTQDVAAVVNQIELAEPPIWNFQPALAGLRDLRIGLMRSIPLILFSLLILLVTWMITRFSVTVARLPLSRRLSSPLLGNVAAYAIGVVIFLVGLYVVFQVAGLTNVALTVLGGTGLIGLVLGIAFRDITENFLASIFLSVQNPFESGDLVEVAGILGFVQALTTRATLLMTLDGNHVQIPNATIYKSIIHNYTSNPHRRVDFTIGVGYDDSITAAQEVALKVLEEHPAVLKDPEPLVLVNSLGSATVNLRIYFWLDGSQHSWLKVKSSVIRLVKRAFQSEAISMPDEAREMIFPQGVSVRLLEPDGVEEAGAAAPEPALPRSTEESESIWTKAEAGLRSEAEEIQEQSRQSRQPEEGENLLKPSSSD